jgi:formate/nitrite transporter FocA (FNT family)
MTDEEDGTPEFSERGAPAVGAVVRDRFGTEEVFQRIVAAADHEMDTRNRELFFSGLAAGFSITLTFLLYASTAAKTDSSLVAALLYPLGFVYIVLGGYQLYTENTLPPVTLVLERLASIPALLRVWAVVVAGNFVGGALGAVLLAETGVFEPAAAEAATEIALEGIETPPADLFFKAAFAGFVVAGVVWLDFSARDTVSRVLLVYLAFLAIPVADLFHVVVSFTEVVYLFLGGHAALAPGVFGFVLPVLVGNTVGGVLLVTVVNYFQTTERRVRNARQDGPERQLSARETLIGGLTEGDRSYVPTRKRDDDRRDG